MKNINNLIEKFLKFLLVTGGATAIDLTLYIILFDYLGPLLAKLTSITIASAAAFFMNKYFTFTDENKIDPPMVIKYVLVQFANIACNVGINTASYYYTDMKIFSFILATVVATIVNFILQKKFVFD